MGFVCPRLERKYKKPRYGGVLLFLRAAKWRPFCFPSF
nr:MAG TPA: hypothetical protein [Caudoviricetes sp.]